jgi:hypothetical protein
VTRYLAVHGTGRVSAAVLVAPLLPSLLKTTILKALAGVSSTASRRVSLLTGQRR